MNAISLLVIVVLSLLIVAVALGWCMLDLVAKAYIKGVADMQDAAKTAYRRAVTSYPCPTQLENLREEAFAARLGYYRTEIVELAKGRFRIGKQR